MDENISESQERRSGLGLHELGEDLQDLGQVTVNLAGDLLQLAGALIRLPLLLLPEETRTHLKNAAREAGMATQAVVESSISAVNEGMQQFNRNLRESRSASDDEATDAIVIEDEATEAGGGMATNVEPLTTNEAGGEDSNREVVDPNLEG